MKKYEQYKDSGVAWIGDIPSHWRVCKTKYIANLFTGNSLNDSQKEEYSISASDSTLPYVATKDITAENDTINYSNGINIPKNSLLKVAPENTFLLCVEGGSAGRKIAYNTSPAYFVNKLCCFESKINPRYHYYFVKSHGFANIFKQSIQGLIGGVSVSTLNNLEIAIPSMEEQQAIVRFLDYKVAKIDQLIAESEVQIEELGKYKTAMISEVVTKGLNPDAPMRDSGIEWIGEIPAHWVVKRIKYIGKAENGLTYTPGDICDDTEGTLVLRSSNIQNGKLVFDDNVYVRSVPDSLKVRKGDIIICSRNGSASLVGKSALVEKDMNACFGAFMMRFRSDFDSKYIHFLLTAAISQYKQLFTTTTINQLTIGLINNIAMPLIENAVEQKSIVDYLDKKCADIDSVIRLLIENIEQLKIYKTTLISEAVTGQIDVRDWHEK